MITTEVELLTAEEALERGLKEALEQNSVKIEGSYEISNNDIVITQKTFIFKSKIGDVVYARFKDNIELFKFVTMLKLSKNQE